MAKSLQQKMSPILQRIASALIAATPESWTTATMRVEFNREPNGDTVLGHSIWSEQPPTIAFPTDEIYAATHELYQLCEKAKKPWSALVFRIQQVDEGWKFTTDLEYDTKK